MAALCLTYCIPNGSIMENDQEERGAFMDNKEKILRCALDLFYAKGYDAVGVQEIAEKAE